MEQAKGSLLAPLTLLVPKTAVGSLLAPLTLLAEGWVLHWGWGLHCKQ